MVMPFVGCGSETFEPRPPWKWAKKIQPTSTPLTKTSIFELFLSQLAVLATQRNVTGPSPLVTFPVLLAIAVGIGSQYLPARIPRELMERFSRLPVVAQAGVLALGLMVTSVMGPEGVAPFIYFRF